MSFTFNRVMLLGRAGAAPESRYTASGQRVATVSIATERPARSGAVPTTDWHHVVCWDKLAEVAVERVTKGRLLFVEGAITYRTWQNQQGQNHTVTEVVARELILLDQPAPPSAGAPNNQGGLAARRDGRQASRG
jgi:single-strand DNA-binding protein